MPKITLLGDGDAVWLLAAAALLITKKYRRYGVLLLVALALGVLTGNLTLKPLIARPRPCWVDESVRLLIPKPTDYSFPSGHTLSSVIGATVLTKANAKFGLAAIPLAALIAFSRLYLYVHFLGAAVLGVAIGLLVCAAGGRVITALTEKGIASRFGWYAATALYIPCVCFGTGLVFTAVRLLTRRSREVLRT